MTYFKSISSWKSSAWLASVRATESVGLTRPDIIAAIEKSLNTWRRSRGQPILVVVSAHLRVRLRAHVSGLTKASRNSRWRRSERCRRCHLRYFGKADLSLTDYLRVRIGKCCQCISTIHVMVVNAGAELRGNHRHTIDGRAAFDVADLELPTKATVDHTTDGICACSGVATDPVPRRFRLILGGAQNVANIQGMVI